MDDTTTLALSILDQGFVMSLATVDEGGPWVSDVIYVHSPSFELYWKSFDSARHSKAIVAGSKVAATVTLTKGPKEPDIGLQIEGTAQRVEEKMPEFDEKLAQKMQKPAFVTGLVEKVISGHYWYKLTPSKVELIHQPTLGYQKRQILLAGNRQGETES